MTLGPAIRPGPVSLPLTLHWWTFQSREEADGFLRNSARGSVDSDLLQHKPESPGATV
jgi:hypothetical protein